MAAEPHRATARVLDILENLADSDNEGKTLTELSAALDAPKSSLFPILHTLADRGYVQTEPASGRYTVGVAAYALGAAYTHGRSALTLILRVMEDITAACDETCQLAVLERSNVLYLGKVDSSQAIRLVSHVGSRLPASCTALGKALLSGLTEAQVRALYPNGLPTLTEHTTTDIELLLQELDQIRETGISAESEEVNLHVGCFAVPLRQHGRIFAAISVSVPLFRATPEKEALIRACLLKARAEIEALAEAGDFHLDTGMGLP